MRTPPAAQADRFILRRMGLGDLEFATELHRQAFPTNVMGRLGTPLLKAYYRTFLDGPEVWAQVAIADGCPVGYLVGVLDVSPYRRNRQTHHGPALAIAGLRGVLTNPVLMARLMLRRLRRMLGRFKRRHSAPGSIDRRHLAVLSHVAVVTTSRSQGIGDALVQGFLEAAWTSGADAATLATLAGEKGAGAFYEARDWSMVSQCNTADHRAIRIYELPFSPGLLGGGR